MRLSGQSIQNLTLPERSYVFSQRSVILKWRPLWRRQLRESVMPLHHTSNYLVRAYRYFFIIYLYRRKPKLFTNLHLNNTIVLNDQRFKNYVIYSIDLNASRFLCPLNCSQKMRSKHASNKLVSIVA